MGFGLLLLVPRKNIWSHHEKQKINDGRRRTTGDDGRRRTDDGRTTDERRQMTDEDGRGRTTMDDDGRGRTTTDNDGYIGFPSITQYRIFIDIRIINPVFCLPPWQEIFADAGDGDGGNGE